MRDVKFSVLFDKSMDRMVAILFSPFRWKLWLKLAFIALLAGALSGGSGGGGNGSNRAATDQSISESKTTESSRDIKDDEAAESDTGDIIPPADQMEKITGLFLRWWPVIVVPLVLFFTFFLWLSSRFKFIWLHAILTKEVCVRENFRAYKHQGNSLFGFSFLFSVVSLAAFAVPVMILWNTLSRYISTNGSDAPSEIWTFVGLLSLIGVFLVAFATLWLFVEDFVVPIMSVDKTSFRESAGRFARVFAANKKDMLLYIVFKILLGIAAFVANFILVIGVAIAFVLSGLFIFGIMYLIFGVLIKVVALFWVLAVLIGIPFVVAFFIVVMMVQLPFAVFFRSFSIYYLASLRSGYEPLSLD